MTPCKPKVAFVAGSGINLHPLLDSVAWEMTFDECMHLPPATVNGHEGRFLAGWHNDTPLLIQQGRLHVYEGRSMEETARTVDILFTLGIQDVVFTNAAGGLREHLKPCSLMAVTAIIPVPTALWPGEAESLTLDHTVRGCDAKGRYIWVTGPTYETRAEIKMYAKIADAIGMSTAAEVMRCKELGIKTAAISCITNNCLQPQPLTHEHVIANGQKASARLLTLLRAELASSNID